MDEQVRVKPNDHLTQQGTVLVFKEGVSEAEVDKALRSIEKLLERPPVVHSFNPEYGGPVWYIP